jgi:integrase
MAAVKPLKNKQHEIELINYLEVEDPRMHLFYLISRFTGFRAGDILTMRVRDVKDREYICLIEEKTNKERKVKINKDLKKALVIYIAGKKNYEVLFPSRKGANKPISVTQAYRLLRGAAENLGIEGVGTQTGRKGFGYAIYKRTGDIALVQALYNHAATKTTMSYLDIDQEVRDDAIDNLSL